jgi:alkanesulfonate monooxygenase SsuD/methylene tetrahydromethanopterin reductase-like flavin-dependent oxidoreductase (luciferase family)
VKVNVFAMPTIPATLEERERLRPVGRSTERYQMMLQELRDLVKAADALGIDAFGTTEHHFHTEGGEACPNPLLMYSHLAGITERIAFIPMSIVLPAGDPIRIAEDVALFDQMYPGRVGVCFARGYQKRWIQVVTQRAKLTSWEDEDADRVNREVFDEYLEVVLKAWTEETFDYDGKHYQVPYPHSGIEGWAAPEWTRRYGADGEIDENGVIRRIGVIPPPYTKPHPPVFRPFAATPKTLYQAAAAGHVAVTQEGRAEQFGHWCAEYQRVAQEAGRDVRLGEGMGARSRSATPTTRRSTSRCGPPATSGTTTSTPSAARPRSSARRRTTRTESSRSPTRSRARSG